MNQEQAIVKATKKKKYEMVGVGCLIQAIGLVLLFFFPVGTFLGIVLLIFGSLKSAYWVCSHCGNRITDKEIRICPTCKAELL